MNNVKDITAHKSWRYHFKPMNLLPQTKEQKEHSQEEWAKLITECSKLHDENETLREERDILMAEKDKYFAQLLNLKYQQLFGGKDDVN